MKNSFNLLYNFIFKTKRRWLTVKAVYYAAVARFRIYFYPEQNLHKYLGEKGAESALDAPGPDEGRKIAQVADKIKRVARRVPWDSKCLVQGMAAQRLLKDFKIKSTLYLGVGRDRDNGGKMVAHAWVRSGPYSVCGGIGEGYEVVAKFLM